MMSLSAWMYRFVVWISVWVDDADGQGSEGGNDDDDDDDEARPSVFHIHEDQL